MFICPHREGNCLKWSTSKKGSATRVQDSTVSHSSRTPFPPWCPIESFLYNIKRLSHPHLKETVLREFINPLTFGRKLIEELKSKGVVASVKPNLSMLEAKHTSLSASYQTDASVEEEKPSPSRVCVCVCVYVYICIYLYK